MLIVGIVVLLLSIIVERVATIRTARLVNAAGGDWESRDFRYSREVGATRAKSERRNGYPPSRCSATPECWQAWR